MKRNKYGMNFDEGVPLNAEKEVDFACLYVDCFEDTVIHLYSWLNEGDAPLILGGQIGSGKSTLINYALKQCNKPPDIILHFDQDALSLGAGDFLAIALNGFIKFALEQQIELSDYKLPEELGKFEPDNWKALSNSLQSINFSYITYEKVNDVRKTIAEKSEYVRQFIIKIGHVIQTKIGRKLFIFASGIDKYNISSTSYFSLQEVISVLIDFKTLFEVNAIHFFSRFHSLNRLLIPVAETQKLIEILCRRMGIYAQSITKEIEIIAHLSGGNPRQAIRLLVHFWSAKFNLKPINRNRIAHNVFGFSDEDQNPSWDCISYAIVETTGDFFSCSSKPDEELMKSILKTGKIKTAYFSAPRDSVTAILALYGNWIFLKELSDDVDWNVIINPLVKNVFSSISAQQTDIELKMLSDYHSSIGISSNGLDFNIIDEKTGRKKPSDQILQELLSTGYEHPLALNILEILNIISNALLSKDRADRVIIAYKNYDLLDPARAYLFAKANSYEYQRYCHSTIEGGIGQDPIYQLNDFLVQNYEIYSIEFKGKWNITQLEVFDKQRDRFLDKQMILWIHWDDLKTYLIYWTQLRQLFEIFILEDELLNSLSKEEIESDLLLFKDLEANLKESSNEVITNLKKVLEYLKKVKAGAEHGR